MKENSGTTEGGLFLWTLVNTKKKKSVYLSVQLQKR